MKTVIVSAIVAVLVAFSFYIYAQSAMNNTSSQNTPAFLPQNTAANGNSGYFMIQLNENTFVTGKNLGDSQQIMVFKVSHQGQLVLTQKAKFMY